MEDAMQAGIQFTNPWNQGGDGYVSHIAPSDGDMVSDSDVEPEIVVEVSAYYIGNIGTSADWPYTSP